MVYYLKTEDFTPGLVSRFLLDESGNWSSPQALAPETPFGNAFDVVARGGDHHSILGMGMQPTCPCNTIHHQEHDPALGWLPDTNLIRNSGHYSWPGFARLAADNDGRLHAFWYQESRDFDFTFLRENFFYFVREDGDWVNAGDDLFPSSFPASTTDERWP